MTDITASYMGLALRNPIIVSSSGLTQTLDGVARCAEAGAGAVILKSIFEEEIRADTAAAGDVSALPDAWHHEAEQYLARYGMEDAVGGYLKLIRDAKRTVDIPVIASINCVTADGWTDFARRAEEAGADGIELNVFVLPSDPRRDARANEQVYFDVAKRVTKAVSVPVALKVGPYFSALSRTLTELSRTGIRGLVLFNRFIRIDMDIESFELRPADLYSQPQEMLVPLRWISILYGRVQCDLAATTGVHDGVGVIKQLLAGAAAVQVCSTLYRDDPSRMRNMIEVLEDWMRRHRFESLADFRGRLCQKRNENPAAFERVQFMRGTSGTA